MECKRCNETGIVIKEGKETICECSKPRKILQDPFDFIHGILDVLEGTNKDDLDEWQDPDFDEERIIDDDSM